MTENPSKVLRVEFGLLNGETWKTLYFCEPCFHEYFNKFHPSFGYDILNETNHGTCSQCKLDTSNLAQSKLNLRKQQKRK